MLMGQLLVFLQLLEKDAEKGEDAKACFTPRQRAFNAAMPVR